MFVVRGHHASPVTSHTLLYITLPWLLVMLGSVTAADPVLTPQTLEDQWGNAADEDSNVVWGPLPTGSPYQTDPSYKTEGLDVLFDMTKQFLDIVQPNDLPYDMITDVINGDFEISDNTDDLREYMMGFAVCFAIGILFILIMPIVGCCFCCCRLCGKCGGKKYQRQTDSTNCRRVTYSIVLFILTICMGASVVCIYVSNERMNDAVDTMGDTATSNLDDLDTFLENTVEEINHIAKENFAFTTDVITRDLENIGVLLGIPVRDELNTEGGIDDALQAVSDFEALVEVVAVDVLAINSSVQSLKQNGNTLQADLDAVKIKIKAATTIVPSVGCSPDDKCTAMNTAADELDMDADFDNLPDITDQADQIADVQSKDLTQMVEDGRAEFNDIPYTVQNDTKDVIQSLIDQLADFSDTIDDQLADIQDLPDTLDDNLDDIKEDIDSLSENAQDYNQYRWYAGLGLAGIVALVVLLQLFGLILGICGHSKHAGPTERGCLSNSGGNMLMAATVFIFIFSWLLMLLTSFSFLIGGNLEKLVCEPLTDPDYKIFSEVLDKPGNLQDGYILGDIILDNSSVALTFQSILEDCKANKAAYTAMRLDSIVDIDEVTNYKDTININDEIDKISVDLSSVQIMDSSTKDELREFSDSVQIDYDGFKEELSKNTTKVDLAAFATQVRDLAASSTDPAKGELNTAAGKLDDINTGIYQTVNDDQAQLLSDINSFEGSTGNISKSVNDTIDAVEASENFLHTRAESAIKNESLNYAERLLATADSFADNTLTKIKEDVGLCEPVWTIYESTVHVLLCQQTIDSFNGFWFGIGWAIFFMVPSLIFNVKLAKHFRKMKFSDGLDPVDASAPPYPTDGQLYGKPPPYGQPPHHPAIHSNKVGHNDLKY